MMRARIGSLVLTAVAVVAFAACGSDSAKPYSEPTGPALKTLKVEATNFSFTPDRLTAPAGIVEVDMTSANGVHDFVIEGIPGFQVEATSGETSSRKIELEPGKYTFYCSVSGHRAQGMEGTLTVT